MTADTTLSAEVDAIMADVILDVPGVATAFGRRAIAQHNSPPMVGWWPAGPEAPGAPKKSAFPGGARSLWTGSLTLTVRCWGIAATPGHTYAATDLDATMELRRSVLAAIHRRWPGVYQWKVGAWAADPSATDLGEQVDLTVTVDLAILDRAPPRATVTSTALTTAVSPVGDGVLQPGETT